MLTYTELNQQLNEKKKEYVILKSAVDSEEKDKNNIQQERNDLNFKFQNELSTAKTVAYQNLEDSVARPLEDKILSLSKEKDNLVANRDNELHDITKDKYLEKFKDDVDIYEDIKNSLLVLREKISNVLGTRFSDTLHSGVLSADLELDTTELSGVSSRFNHIIKKVDRMSIGRGFDFEAIINKWFLKINPEKFEANKRHLLIYVGVALLVSLLIVYFLFPILFLVFLILIIVNIKNTFEVYDSILESKSMEDNMSSIDRMIQEEVEAQVESDRNSILEKYNPSIDNLISKIGGLEDKIQLDINKAKQAYIFDDKDIKDNWDRALKAIESKEIVLTANLSDKKERLQLLLKEINILNTQLTESSGLIVDEYLAFDKPKNDFVFNPNFLLDIKDNKPVVFKHSEKSSLFLYEDENDAVQLIRLMSAQIITSLNLFSFNICMWDLPTMCRPFSMFRDCPELIKMFHSKETVEDNINEISEGLIKRISNISKEFPHIKVYNQKMLEMDSLTESYIFLFALNPDANIFDNNKLKQIISNGADLGIIPNIFVKKSEFLEWDERGLEILNLVNTVHFIEMDTVRTRAKEFVQQLFPEK